MFSSASAVSRSCLSKNGSISKKRLIQSSTFVASRWCSSSSSSIPIGNFTAVLAAAPTWRSAGTGRSNSSTGSWVSTAPLPRSPNSAEVTSVAMSTEARGGGGGNDASTTTTAKGHYEKHSEETTYESAYFYEPGEYTEYLSDLVKDRLGLPGSKSVSTGRFIGTPATSGAKRRRVLLDVGGGTGNFTEMILRNAAAADDVVVEGIVVDPFLAADDDGTGSGDRKDGKSRIRFVRRPAEAFLEPISKADDENDDRWWRSGCHQVLLKEVVHHFRTEDRLGIFRGMYDGLVPSSSPDAVDDGNAETPPPPSILVITRPQRDVDYPLWDEAREVWANNQPAVEYIENDLREAGFVDVSHTVESYPCSILLSRWQSMVKNRFWSTFSHFTDEELSAACETIAAVSSDRVDDDGRVHFEDRLLFITGCKTKATSK